MSPAVLLEHCIGLLLTWSTAAHMSRTRCTTAPCCAPDQLQHACRCLSVLHVPVAHAWTRRPCRSVMSSPRPATHPILYPCTCHLPLHHFYQFVIENAKFAISRENIPNESNTRLYYGRFCIVCHSVMASFRRRSTV